jgi:hypothetical protein
LHFFWVLHPFQPLADAEDKDVVEGLQVVEEKDKTLLSFLKFRPLIVLHEKAGSSEDVEGSPVLVVVIKEVAVQQVVRFIPSHWAKLVIARVI